MQTNSQAVPCLNTESTELLFMLERKFLTHREKILQWLNAQWELTPPPVYGSIDLRNAGFKLAPIDMNLFPAGFNNLNPNFLSISVSAAKKAIHRIAPNAKNILIIPENHTRNKYYWENIKTLQKTLESAEFSVRFGSLIEGLKGPMTIELDNNEKVILDPLQRNGNCLSVNDFIPDIILLNNDLSEGIPAELQHLDQPLVPPAELGWSQRLKSEHFQYYEKVATELGEQIDIDPWLIAPLFRHCGQIDFMQQDGMECLVHHAEILFAEIEKKYAQYHIKQKPFLIVKADAGTYGMAVMTLHHVEELKLMNRKQRTRMSKTKGSQPVRRVIIQEGVYTFETFGDDQSVAEPVVYMWGETVAGGFYRVHKDRGVDENLNAPGMYFEPIAFSQTCNEPCPNLEPNACRNRLYTYGIVAQLSMLAAAREIKDQMQK